jgi:hypothetical protein
MANFNVAPFREWLIAEKKITMPTAVVYGSRVAAVLRWCGDVPTTIGPVNDFLDTVARPSTTRTAWRLFAEFAKTKGHDVPTIPAGKGGRPREEVTPADLAVRNLAWFLHGRTGECHPSVLVGLTQWNVRLSSGLADPKLGPLGVITRHDARKDVPVPTALLLHVRAVFYPKRHAIKPGEPDCLRADSPLIPMLPDDESHRPAPYERLLGMVHRAERAIHSGEARAWSEVVS